MIYQRIDTLGVAGFSDSNYAYYIDDKKSTSSFIFMTVEGAVSWKSIKQTLIASFIMEVEYVACYEATCQAIWLRNFISALEIVHSISRPLKLFCDNSTTVSFSRNTMNTSRSKHNDVKLFIVKDKVSKSLISVEHAPTISMLVDPLTKSLPICVFQERVTRMRLIGA